MALCSKQMSLPISNLCLQVKYAYDVICEDWFQMTAGLSERSQTPKASFMIPFL
jgi:hypothetical protein